MFHCNLKKTKTKYTNSMKSYRSLCSKEQQWECRTEPTKRGTENNRIIITILSAQGLMVFFFHSPIILALTIWWPESSSTNQIQCTSTPVILKGYRLVMWWQWQELFQQGWISVHLWGPLTCLNQPWYLKVHFGKITGWEEAQSPKQPPHASILTSHWREEDANQHHEWCGDIWQHIQVQVVLLACYIHRGLMCSLQYLSFLQIIAP